ncbi:hypothetical protein [Methylobacterium goesingense]|uniref:Uncharacterized protein n=1 Tax=Methylobacterium goesingense TaxID=243690 RepID=A0ABV2LCL1_9HYPH|nr:hypothetical protein [Methylobacterium goesingense]GJD73610.1 hypothetical protein CFIICLFH_1839 [Methylobacterium goesingense]
MAERDALGALTVEVADLRLEVATLGAAMGQIIVGQQAQTALLDALLAAVTDLGAEGGGDGLAEALGRIADSLDAQGDSLDGMRAGLDAIPGAVAVAIQAGR